MPYSDKEVVEYVQVLQQETQLLRDESKEKEDVALMRKLPRLPKDLERKQPMYFLSPEVIREEKEIRAMLLSFQTEVKSLPLARGTDGTITDAIQKAVDTQERAGAIFLRKTNPDRRLESAIIHAQLVKPLAVVVMEMGAIDKADPAERFPWRLFDVDLDGCGWFETNGVPTIFGRQYAQMVHSTENEYAGRSGEGPQAMVRWDNGKWHYAPLTDDWAPRRAPMPSSRSGAQRADLMCLDDGEEVVHVVLNEPSARFSAGPFRVGTSSKREGLVAWRGPNPFGRVGAFLIPGNETSERPPVDRWLAYLLELIVVVEQRNAIRSIRASAARNRASPRDYVHSDPEVLKQYMTQHGDLPQAIEWSDEKTPYTYGKVEERPISVDPDLDKLEQRLEMDIQRYTHASLSALRDPEVVKGSTAAAFLGAWDSAMMVLGPIIGAADTFRRQVLEAWENSIKWIDREHGSKYAEFNLLANGLEGVRKLPAGGMIGVNAKTFDTAHEWRISTRSRTLAQAQAAYQLAAERFQPLPDGKPGIGIYSELFEAADISDVDERQITLTAEAGVAELTPWAVELAKISARHAIEVDSGIQVALLEQQQAAQQQQQAAAAAPPAGGGNNVPTGNRTNSPATEPAEGGSGPNITG